MNCTPCGQPVPDGSAAIFGIERAGKMAFGWTCCHQPAGDVAVILASATCAASWLTHHPEYLTDITTMVIQHRLRHRDQRRAR